MKGLYLPVLATINRGEGMKPSALKITLVIDVASNIIKDPLDHTRVGEQRKPILERQNVSQNNTVLIPAPYLHINGFQFREPNPIVHIPSIRGMIPQVIITVLQNGLRVNRREGDRGDDGGG